jgi:hypothetical protein
MGQGGVEVKVSGNSAFISGVVQIGAYGSGMINTLNNSQPIALNAWSPADATFLQRSPRHAAVDHVKRGNQSCGRLLANLNHPKNGRPGKLQLMHSARQNTRFVMCTTFFNV